MASVIDALLERHEKKVAEYIELKRQAIAARLAADIGKQQHYENQALIVTGYMEGLWFAASSACEWQAFNAMTEAANKARAQAFDEMMIAFNKGAA